MTSVKRNKLLVGLFFGVVLADQISKVIIDRTFNLNETLPLVGDVLYLRYIRNPGIAFGLSLGHPLVMLGVTTLIIAVMGGLFIKGKIASESVLEKIAMVMVLGGAIGNLLDRIRMREVIDFIDMGIGSYRWPVYNLADTFVTVGMAMLVFTIVFGKERQKPDENTSFTRS